LLSVTESYPTNEIISTNEIPANCWKKIIETAGMSRINWSQFSIFYYSVRNYCLATRINIIEKNKPNYSI
jgi:hypothetical protein